jgi:hypothetical protein
MKWTLLQVYLVLCHDVARSSPRVVMRETIGKGLVGKGLFLSSPSVLTYDAYILGVNGEDENNRGAGRDQKIDRSSENCVAPFYCAWSAASRRHKIAEKTSLRAHNDRKRGG